MGRSVIRAPPMAEVIFVDSTQGHQTDRLREIADRVRGQWPDVAVRVVEGEAAGPLLAEHKLNFGPAIVIDGRLEYVGIPRWRFLQERIAQVVRGLPNPRTAAPPPKAKPATPSRPAGAAPATPGPGVPPRPAIPPAPKAAPPPAADADEKASQDGERDEASETASKKDRRGGTSPSG